MVDMTKPIPRDINSEIPDTEHNLFWVSVEF